MSIILSVSAASPYAYAITYNVAPVDLSDGYAITGGFIETNGQIGPLMNSDITSYQVSVSGPNPYVFEPSNPGAFYEVEGNVTDSLSAITLPVPEDAFESISLSFLASAPKPGCVVWPNCWMTRRSTAARWSAIPENPWGL